MIRIESVKKTQEMSVKYDLYIPLDIEFGRNEKDREPIQYWRTGDFQKSLLEIGFSKYKEIQTITLVICDKMYKAQNRYEQFRKTTIGLPIVRIDNCSEKTYIDEKRSFNVYMSENNISILFDESPVWNRIINKDIEFFLDSENNWIGMRINHISAQNMKLFISAVSGSMVE